MDFGLEVGSEDVPQIQIGTEARPNIGSGSCSGSETSFPERASELEVGCSCLHVLGLRIQSRSETSCHFGTGF